MAGNVLIDTNVLIYDTGVDGPEKAAIAAAALNCLEARQAGVLSTQVLSEYVNTMLRRLPRADRADVVLHVADLRETWPIAPVTEQVIVDAIRGVLEYGMPFYDAQIWAAARLAGVEVVLTEDFADGAEIEGVRFVDPFAPGFDPRVLAD